MDEQTTKILVFGLLEQIKSRFNLLDGYLQNNPELILNPDIKNKLVQLYQAIDNLDKIVK